MSSYLYNTKCNSEYIASSVHKFIVDKYNLDPYRVIVVLEDSKNSSLGLSSMIVTFLNENDLKLFYDKVVPKYTCDTSSIIMYDRSIVLVGSILSSLINSSMPS